MSTKINKKNMHLNSTQYLEQKTSILFLLNLLTWSDFTDFNQKGSNQYAEFFIFSN